MGSAFDDLTPSDAEFVRSRLLAGDRMHEIRDGMDISARQMRKLRDEVFQPLIDDPEEVKRLAAGGILNPLKLVRYTHARRRAQRLSIPKQQDMFG